MHLGHCRFCRCRCGRGPCCIAVPSSFLFLLLPSWGLQLGGVDLWQSCRSHVCRSGRAERCTSRRTCIQLDLTHGSGSRRRAEGQVDGLASRVACCRRMHLVFEVRHFAVSARMTGTEAPVLAGDLRSFRWISCCCCCFWLWCWCSLIRRCGFGLRSSLGEWIHLFGWWSS